MRPCATPSLRRASATLLPLALAACVSRGAYHEVEAERDALTHEKQQLEERIELLQASNESLGSERVKLIDEMETLREAHDALDRDVNGLRAAKAELTENLQAREAELAARRAEVEQLRGTYDGLVKDLESEVATGQIEIQQLREGLQLNLTQDVLFASGSAELNDAGRSVLGKVAQRLKDLPQRVEVRGHTDSVPIRGALAARFASNWELAGARASGVVRFLAEHKVDPKRLISVSHGEYEPIAPNDTPEGRQKNRRIEITLEPLPANAASAAPPAKAAAPEPPQPPVSPASGSRVRLERCFRAALAAADAGDAVARVLERDGARLRLGGEALPDAARLVVLAVGKAAAPMAAAVEALAGDRIAAGLAVTKEGHTGNLARMPLREAAHPVPDARSERAAREALALVEAASPADVLLVLLSGGASSLLACPAPDLSLGELAQATQVLLSAGADIEELNTVRKHLGALAGGRLAQRARAQRIELLVVSDVPGDRLDLIGSGPLSPDPSRYADALAAVDRCGARDALPARVLAHLAAGAAGRLAETPKPGDPALARVRAHLLASNATARAAALAAARSQGAHACDLGARLRGEASTAGGRLAALARALRAGSPICIVAGGETTVRVRGPGRGGRSQELALAAALELAGDRRATLLAAGTDGSDGPTRAAGAFADGGTLARARQSGLDARAALARNDSSGFFEAEGGLFVTGPTRTNVMDLALLWIEPGPG